MPTALAHTRRDGRFFACSVNEHNIDTVKWRWIKADRPRKADWDELLAGIDVPPEEAAKSKAQ